MALTKITSTNIGANAVANSIGYTPANKAGDTFTGTVNFSSVLAVNNNTSGNGPYPVRLNRANNACECIITFTDNATSFNSYIGYDNDGSNLFQIGNDTYWPALRVDPTSRINMPFQPAFLAKPTTNAGTEMSGSIFTWTSVSYNVGNCYSTSTGKFTAPIAGYYLFTFTSMANSGTGRYQTYLSINGGNWTCSGGGDSTNYGHSNGSAIVYLNVNDYVFHGKNTGTPYGSFAEHSFSGRLLG